MKTAGIDVAYKTLAVALGEGEKTGKARDVIRLSLERLEINCSFRRRCNP